MLELFLFIIWFWLLIAIFGDLFRDPDTGGGVKALWVVLLVILPFLGILLYLIVRGKGMGARQAAQLQAAQSAFDDRIRSATGSSATDQIAQAKALLDSGAIDQAEFAKLKAAALGS
ncbi:SHOCT domain-containing protein [Cellulomonas humilata]|uniref:SHOCT domain-containing protein n=2 Tax=Cellulomonas humilata TaxID=144055 RepID=A0A7Y6DZP1_9CELL|nr:SHOCT domain-containing protein [Cellulomonas humilata]NUU19690.1 SHOCT domain-containing protein [Cellulomonas humilata]